MRNACIDSETVSGNYTRRVGGGVTGSSLYLETGSAFRQPGQGSSSVVTNDGSYSGEIRGINVDSIATWFNVHIP